MVATWDSDFHQYDLGDVVEYNGDEYEVIQPHRSQSDWPPNTTPMLWGKISKSHSGGYQQPQQQPQQQGLKWVLTDGRLNIQSLNATPVEGGYDDDGTPLYIARASWKGGMHPGKASTKFSGAQIPYGGEEKMVNEYEILCYP